MGTSSIGHVRNTMYHIIKSNPESVLDIGVGFGRWGFLCREMLDVFNGRTTKDKWKIRIDGIEIYEPYIQPHQRYLYDQIHIGDAKTVINTLGEYGVIIIGDMMEHLAKEDGWALFHAAMNRTKIGLMLNIPIGEGWLRETGGENKYEDHLSWWDLEEFRDYLPQVYLTTLDNGMEHASIFIPAENYKYLLILVDGDRAEREKAYEKAAKLYSDAIKLVPRRPEAFMVFANMLMELRQISDAQTVLYQMSVLCPEFVAGRVLLARLQAATGSPNDAYENLKIAMEQVEKGVSTEEGMKESIINLLVEIQPKLN